MKVVFLDFDGVLNCSTTPKECSLDREFVERLNLLLEVSGAVVVLTTTWRLTTFADPLAGVTVCRNALDETGFRGEVIGLTPHLAKQGVPSIHRGLEIQAWLDAQPEKPESFVILDDDSDMAHLIPYLVKTTMKEGLQDVHVKQALEILGS